MFVIGSKIDPLKKTDFYKPSILQITPDVKFQMSIPTGKSQAIRMGFYWGIDLIMNITAIDYFRQ
jgi:dihydropteroate synthase